MSKQYASDLATPLQEKLLALGVLLDHHYFEGRATQIQFSDEVDMASAWVDEAGQAHLSINPKHVAFMSTEQLVFLVGHEYGHLVMQHPQKTTAIQAEYGVASVLDEFMLPPDKKRDYSKQMRDMELEADLFGARVAKGLGHDPVAGASFLLAQTKSIQHPEGPLRVHKIKILEGQLQGDDYSTSLADVTHKLGTTPWATLAQHTGEPIQLKAFVQVPQGHKQTTLSGQAGFEVPLALTVLALAGALPRWWRRLRWA
ncbi:hypothetical protein [Limnobacter sp.]|uniref:hypothetical protein n=1 Tax=Limnobacter sp. TaxID=2003368 RepID=UPI003512073D